MSDQNYFEFHLITAKFHLSMAEHYSKQNNAQLEQLHLFAYKYAKKEAEKMSALIEAHEVVAGMIGN